jgi:sugar phosphate isomerase/epimerase
MKLAIQEDMLPGASVSEKLRSAQQLGFKGVEFWVDAEFPRHLPEIAAALAQTNMQCAAVNVGLTRLIHPEYVVRDQAIAAMRQAMTYAVDLGAQGVIFKPFYSPSPVLPDLRPYKSSLELEAELLVTQLRATLTDLAYALGTELFLEPVNHQETHLVRRVDHAVTVRRKLDDHPHIKIAANLYHMQMEGENLVESLRQHITDIGYIHIADTQRVLPGEGQINFGEIVSVLKGCAYSGWLTLECGTPGSNNGQQMADNFPAMMDTLHSAGLI